MLCYSFLRRGIWGKNIRYTCYKYTSGQYENQYVGRVINFVYRYHSTRYLFPLRFNATMIIVGANKLIRHYRTLWPELEKSDSTATKRLLMS